MLKAGVIGTGFMGGLHVRVYSELTKIDFAGIFDQQEQASEAMSKKYGVASFKSMDDLLKNTDIVSIAVPTSLHHGISLKCLAAGKHILVEKPLAATVDEAVDIIKKAEENKLVAAVGYIERFNPAVLELIKLLSGKKIKEIYATRLAPPVNRANDVSVVFDLMIHDIDIVGTIAGSKVNAIEASGKMIDSSVLNDVTCILSYENGIKAKIVSNKVADQKKRALKVVCDDCVFEADLIAKTIRQKDLKGESLISPASLEPIKAEILDFIDAVEKGTKPKVSAADSLTSLKIAYEIEKKALS